MNGEEVVNFRNKNAKIFSDYVINNFNMAERGISYKYYHTFRVAELCYKCAKKLNLNPKSAYNIGLLHDYARFSQWARFQTFSDKDSFDHADEAGKLLFDLGEIKQFKINKKQYDIIRFAIENHNKFKMDISNIETKKHSEQFMFYSNLIRECDKADILTKFAEQDFVIKNFEQEKSGVSKKVLNSFKNHELVNMKDIKTKLDEILCRICLLYDFVYTTIFKLISVDALLENIKINYSKMLTEKDAKLLSACIEEVKHYFSGNIK